MTGQERAHYRVRYPASRAPLFRCSTGLFPVSNVSEAGFAFVFDATSQAASHPPPVAPFQPGDAVEGRIVFGDRGEEEVRGVLLRLRGGWASVKLDPGAWIPYPRVLSEQFHGRRVAADRPGE